MNLEAHRMLYYAMAQNQNSCSVNTIRPDRSGFNSLGFFCSDTLPFSNYIDLGLVGFFSVSFVLFSVYLLRIDQLLGSHL